MNTKMMTRIGLAAALAVGASPHARSADMHMEMLPGMTDSDCKVPGSTYKATPCASMTFPIQVFPVFDINNAVQSCVAAMPYNRLTIHTGDATVTSGLTTTLTWKLQPIATTPPMGTAVSASFKGAGVALNEIHGHKRSDLFCSTSACDQGTASSDTFTIDTVPANTAKTKKFDHTPVVEVTVTKGATTTTVVCLGVDPLISNAAD